MRHGTGVARRAGRALLLALLACMGTLQAQEAAPAAAPGGMQVSPCSPLLDQILPGDYNFCMGARDLREGRAEKGLERMRRAASWGDKSAQKVLGLAYFNGEGVGQDRALGLAWLALSIERREPENVALYNSAVGQVTPREKTRALSLYNQMRLTYADEVAATRADRLFRRKVRALASNPVYGSGKCIAGVNALEFANPNAEDERATISVCSLASETRVINGLKARYDVYFRDWNGHVQTGPLQQVP